MIQIERRHFGVLVPSTNTTVEIEYTHHLPATLQFHTARLGKGGNTPFSPSRDEDVIYQSKLLGDAKVEVVALAQTSASLFDDDYDAKVKALDVAKRRRAGGDLGRGDRRGGAGSGDETGWYRHAILDPGHRERETIL